MKIKFEHYRFIDYEHEPIRYYRRAEYNSPLVRGKVKTKGGITKCLIFHDDDKELIIAQGMAVCSLKDNYDYRLGRRIALGRALKELEQ